MDARSTTAETIPDQCEFGSCTKEPKYRAKFSKPKDHVYYCRECVKNVTGLDNFKFKQTV